MLDYYRTRFLLEFCFRDGKQHLYRYYLAFIDKSGNDLLADVPFEINSERDSVLLRGTYTFERCV